jgi:hypothetical protein
MNTPITPLALRPRDAAVALGISERLLWTLTAPRGPIPCKRRGGRGGVVLYRPEDLDAWLRSSDSEDSIGPNSLGSTVGEAQ